MDNAIFNQFSWKWKNIFKSFTLLPEVVYLCLSATEPMTWVIRRFIYFDISCRWLSQVCQVEIFMHPCQSVLSRIIRYYYYRKHFLAILWLHCWVSWCSGLSECNWLLDTNIVLLGQIPPPATPGPTLLSKWTRQVPGEISIFCFCHIEYWVFNSML